MIRGFLMFRGSLMSRGPLMLRGPLLFIGPLTVGTALIFRRIIDDDFGCHWGP